MSGGLQSAPDVSRSNASDRTSAVIRLVNVYKTFGKQAVLDGASLEIPRGKLTTIIGRSGGGKSVLLKHLIGLLRPDRGQVLVE